MKEVLKKYWLLILIAVLAFLLRVYKLGEYPVGLTWDEPALGYNAYSILKTGRDEYGNFLPLTFKSFGDYKPGLFIYYLVPFIAVFGLTKFAIRFPSALAGVGTTIAIFFLTRIIFGKRKELAWLPYLSSLLLAISPWNIHFSRGAWEVNLALFTIVMGVIFFIKVMRTDAIRFFLLTFLFFTASFYVYHGAKVFLVVFLIGSLAIFWQKWQNLPKIKKKIGLLLLIFLLIPLFTSFKGSANRARVMSVFSYKRPIKELTEIISQEESFRLINFFLYHSETLNMAKGVFGRYFNHLSGRFLFFEGDWSSPRHSAPYMGMMYYVEIPFLMAGIGYALAKKKKLEESLLFWWLLVSPIPAAVTRDIVHGIRSYWLVIPLVIFTSIGICVVINWLKMRSKKILLIGSLSIIFGYLFCLARYLDLYYINFPKKNSAGWNYGMREIAQIIDEGKKKYRKVIMTQKYGQPFIFYLFYTRYSPQDYQKQAYLKEDPWGDIGIVERIDNIEFRNVYWPDDRSCQNCLFIDDEFGLPDKEVSQTPGARILKKIHFLDGKLAYKVVEIL
jgi:4-amino-4-deoxy-L-arabinose transferase-like glycosyltransferase